MRRKDRQITDLEQIMAMVKACKVIHIGMVDADGKPYVVALNFGAELQGQELVLYFHSALEGKKIDILKQNPNIYFQMDGAHGYIQGDDAKPSSYGWKYDSVMGSGVAERVCDVAEQTHGFNVLLSHMDESTKNLTYSEAMLRSAALFRVRCSDFTAKRHA